MPLEPPRFSKDSPKIPLRNGRLAPAPQPLQAQPILEWLKAACRRALSGDDLPGGITAADWACVREQVGAGALLALGFSQPMKAAVGANAVGERAVIHKACGAGMVASTWVELLVATLRHAATARMLTSGQVHSRVLLPSSGFPAEQGHRLPVPAPLKTVCVIPPWILHGYFMDTPWILPPVQAFPPSNGNASQQLPITRSHCSCMCS